MDADSALQNAEADSEQRHCGPGSELQRINLLGLAKLFLAGKLTVLRWLQTKGFIPQERRCDICGALATLRRTRLMWFCGKSDHMWSQSLTANTILSYSQLSIDRSLTLMYLYANGITNGGILSRETSRSDLPTSLNTITKWLQTLRKAIYVAMRRRYAVEGKIGGRGKVVEIAEHFLMGRWVLGMVEREVGPHGKPRAGKLRFMKCQRNRHDAATLIPIIKKNVQRGTTVISSTWSAYGRLATLGEDRRLWKLKGREPYYCHKVISTRRSFIKSRDIHLQTIESMWSMVKRALPRDGRRKVYLNLYITEQLWRRSVRRLQADPFEDLLAILGDATARRLQSRSLPLRRPRGSSVPQTVLEASPTSNPSQAESRALTSLPMHRPIKVEANLATGVTVASVPMTVTSETTITADAQAMLSQPVAPSVKAECPSPGASVSSVLEPATSGMTSVTQTWPQAPHTVTHTVKVEIDVSTPGSTTTPVSAASTGCAQTAMQTPQSVGNSMSAGTGPAVQTYPTSHPPAGVDTTFGTVHPGTWAQAPGLMPHPVKAETDLSAATASAAPSMPAAGTMIASSGLPTVLCAGTVPTGFLPYASVLQAPASGSGPPGIPFMTNTQTGMIPFFQQTLPAATVQPQVVGFGGWQPQGFPMTLTVQQPYLMPATVPAHLQWNASVAPNPKM